MLLGQPEPSEYRKAIEPAAGLLSLGLALIILYLYGVDGEFAGDWGFRSRRTEWVLAGIGVITVVVVMVVVDRGGGLYLDWCRFACKRYRYSVPDYY